MHTHGITAALVVQQQDWRAQEMAIAGRPVIAPGLRRCREGAGHTRLHHPGNGLKHVLLFHGAMQLPAPKQGEAGRDQQAKQHQQQAIPHHKPMLAADNAGIGNLERMAMQKLLIIAFLVVILWNLGAGLYYMMVDKGTTDRTVRSLTWRIGISVVLILVVIVGIYTGWIKPHGVMP